MGNVSSADSMLDVVGNSPVHDGPNIVRYHIEDALDLVGVP